MVITSPNLALFYTKRGRVRNGGSTTAWVGRERERERERVMKVRQRTERDA